MWDAIGNAIKVFVEKHLIPTIASVALALLSVVLLPDNNVFFLRITNVGTGILFFSCFFLLIEFGIYVISKIKKKHAHTRDEKKYLEAKEKETIEKLWSSVDTLTPGDRKLLYVFLENGNKPIENSSGMWNDYGSIFNSDWVVSTTIPFEFENKDGEQPTDGNGIPIHQFINQGKNLYKLKDDIFQLLKFSKEKYGKISNFE